MPDNQELRTIIKTIVWKHKNLDTPARADANVLVDMLVNGIAGVELPSAKPPQRSH